MPKTLILIPGFGGTTNGKPYQDIISYAKSKKYTIIPINPIWKYRTVSHWYEDAQNKIKGISPKDTVLLGFSLGAYIALLLAQHTPFHTTILCSLSPYFKEQLKDTPAIVKQILGKRRIQDFERHSLRRDLVSKKNTILFGDKEWEYAKHEGEKYSHTQKANFISVPDTEHELNQNYLIAIKKILS